MESNALLHLRQQQQQQQVRQMRVRDTTTVGTGRTPENRLSSATNCEWYSAWSASLRVRTGSECYSSWLAAQAPAVADRASVHAMVGMYLQWTSIQNASRLSRPPFNDHYKFLFVREPLERLVSAYRDKMSRAQWYIPLRQNIVKLFRRHASQKYGLYIHRCFTGDRYSIR